MRDYLDDKVLASKFRAEAYRTEDGFLQGGGNKNCSDLHRVTYVLLSAITEMLGISFDSKLRFQPHVKLAGQRKSTISSALARMLLNIGAPSAMKIADNFNLYISYELSEHVALIGQHLMRQLA